MWAGPTLYRHFETREELILAIARECFQLTSEALSPIHFDNALTAKEKIDRGIRVLMPLADSYHFLVSLWNIAERDQEVMGLYGATNECLGLIDRASAG